MKTSTQFLARLSAAWASCCGRTWQAFPFCYPHFPDTNHQLDFLISLVLAWHHLITYSRSP